MRVQRGTAGVEEHARGGAVVAPRPLRVPENVVQQHIVTLLRTLGAKVYVLGTRRGRGERDHGTHQTPGLPDLLAFLPRLNRRRQVWIEVKAVGGRLRPAQVVFQGLAHEADVDHLVGDLDVVIAWLLFHGYLKKSQVPHYRLPAEVHLP